MIIRRFAPQDAAAVSELIRTTMRVSNTQDYPIERLQPLINYFSPEKVLQLSAERVCFVALDDGQIIGTAALEGIELSTFFVHPKEQGRGIGTLLLQALEADARTAGIPRLTVDASITGVPFYERQGYVRTGAERAGTAGPQIGMVKDLLTRA
jgi:GNAT superfamily N-acetyltransferase